ncbi:MAG: zinc-ribbon domain-containing protein [Desulfuromonadales bacterium]|nr:zinc-ribbon domain-containing protein [Desulfuromonadales bacterium]
MKIECPNCNASGTVPSHAIPEEGRFFNCPRCKHGFTVMKPRDTSSFLVDTCPACNYSSFGEERFDVCPKCGAIIKTFLERQREEQRMVREQELLNVKHGQGALDPPPEEIVSPVAVVMDSLNPVNLVGWGCGVAAAVIVCMGIMGLLDYNTDEIKEQIFTQRDEHVSSLYVFFRYGLMPWMKVLYGTVIMVTVYFFLRCQAPALKALVILIRVMIAFVPLYLLVCFVSWVLQPIPHSVGGYFVQLINMVLLTALFGIPLALLDRFLHDKKIVSQVKL